MNMHVRRVTISDVLDAAMIATGTSLKELTGTNRKRPIVLHRQAAMAAASQITGRSLPMIGRWFGGRDHTTVLHAIRAVEACPERQAIRDEILGAVISNFSHDWVSAVQFQTRRKKNRDTE
jgi:chromosomal replication initiator protein